MKYIILIACFITVQNCIGQEEKQFYCKEFNWRIFIPNEFERVSSADWKRLQNNGAEAIEKTYDRKVENQGEMIFVFKNNQLNYFEANYQPFDISVEGDYLESRKNINQILYQTFKTQLPGAQVDTISSKEKIDNLIFELYKIKIVYPNKMVLNCEMYSRLFDKKEFSVNIMYVDDEKGKAMIKTWKESTFH
jgi:hypothetical protein